jgi:hypothetical protein
MDRGTLGVIIVMGGIVLWAVFSKRKGRDRPGSPGVVFVRVQPPASNVLRNIMVLAILGGLAWFFWWATHTKFWP